MIGTIGTAAKRRKPVARSIAASIVPQIREISARSPAQRAQSVAASGEHALVLWLTPSVQARNAGYRRRRIQRVCCSFATTDNSSDTSQLLKKPEIVLHNPHQNETQLAIPGSVPLRLAGRLLTSLPRPRRAELKAHHILTQVVLYAAKRGARRAAACQRLASDSPVAPLPRRRSARRGCPPFPSLARRHSQPPSADEDAGAARGDGS